MHFDLVDLNLFRHIVEAGSITHGAERAHLALAAASTRVRNMEEALGASLLVRGRQGVTPTQAGRTLLQHARTILRQAESLREDLGAYAGGAAGQIRVLSNTNALTEFLPEALSSFLATHPNVSVDLQERLSDEIVGLIAEGTADIGIVAGTVDVSALETYPFRRDRFVLVVAREHPLARRRTIPFAQVLDYDFVGLDRASALQRFLADKRAGAAAAGAAAQLRRGVPSRRVQRGDRDRAGDDGASGRAHHGDRGGGAHRCLGDAPAYHLHSQPRRAAALCAPIGRALARGRGGVAQFRSNRSLTAAAAPSNRARARPRDRPHCRA
jgi:DNA-binding transcriptional LysR family regulator